MDPTELADPNGFPSSRSAFMLEEPSLQDNQLPTVSAPIVMSEITGIVSQWIRCAAA
jgi:hypothetical protein